ncbi:hypothetical protein N7462_008480 [Penicillium macrosclerotiorum]|uniref:uncharacterized protein n=1 Tax=Penicillium macrosclerotiorum TaxID=303699 RepID=UPI002548738E|nr:uncharacterized protein N7462_008480 [Penicillium macrosclerotiorum]KAJ5675583.1 hypothetical protein N7462_008480 [Penicillium macrosclerotiorum]
MPATQEGRISKRRTSRSQNPTRRVSNSRTLPLVERTNALPTPEFISQYVSPLLASGSTGPETKTQEPLEPTPSPNASLDVYSATTIPAADLEACLDLIEQTSGADYAASGAGWSRPKKRKEMKLPDMKYLILRNATLSDAPNQPVSGASSGSVLGFLSCMVTYEDGKEVIYCYEIHLSPAARGRGLGALLMSRMEGIGRLVGVEKAMLTVFKANMTARQFYEKGGYEVDEYSPQPRRLRNGTIKEFDYLILSKHLTG